MAYNEDQSQQDTSLFSSLGGFTKGVIVYGLAAFLGKAGIKLGARGIEKAFTNYGPKVLNKNFYKSIADQTAKTTQMFSSMSNSEQTYLAWKNNQKSYRKSLYTFSGVPKVANNNIIRSRANLYKDEAKSFFKNDGELVPRIIGKSINMGKAVGADLLTIYGVDNYFIRNKQERQSPLAYLKETLPFVVGMQAFFPLTRALKHGGQLTAAKSANFVVNTLDKHMGGGSVANITNRIQKVDSFTTAFYNSISSSMRLIKNSSVKTGYKNTVESLSKDGIFASAALALRSLKDSANQFRNKVVENIKDINARKKSGFSEFEREISKLNEGYFSHINDNKISREDFITEGLNKYLRTKQKYDRRGNFTYNGLKVREREFASTRGKFSQTSEEFINKVLANVHQTTRLGTPLNQTEIQAIKKTILNAESRGFSLLDNDIYKKGLARIDFRGINPRALLTRGVLALDNMLAVGSIKPLSMFQIPTLVSHQPQTLFSNKNENFIVAKNLVKEHDYFTHDRVGVRANTDTYFINGQLYALDGGRKGEHFKALLNTDLKLRGMHGESALDYTTLRRLSGIDRKFNVDSQSGSFKDRMVKKFELEHLAKPLSTFKNYISKFRNDASPLHFRKLYDSIETGQLTDKSKENFSISLQNILKYADTKSHNIFKKNEVMRSFGVDSAMPDTKLLQQLKDTMLNIEHDKYRSEIVKKFKIDKLISSVSDDTYMRAFDATFTTGGIATRITNRDAAFQFLASINILKSGNKGNTFQYLDEVSNNLFAKGTINKLESSILKVYGQKTNLLQAVQRAENEFIKDESFFNIKNLIRDSLPDYERIGNQFAKMDAPFYKKGARFKNSNNIYSAFRDHSENNLGKDVYRNKGFGVFPTKNAPMEFPIFDKAGQITGYNKVGPFGYIAAMTTQRLNNFLNENLGLGLNIENYQTAASYITKGFTGKRILPFGAAIGGMGIADKLLDAGNIFGGGPLETLADAFVGTRETLASIYDITGVTSTAKYLEGLMPGSINSPLMRGVRGVGSIFAGQAIGMSVGGPAGALAGTLIGAGVSALQGFGYFTMDKSREDLEEIYSGKKEVPVKSGRWWLIGGGPYEGARIKYMSKNWYAKLKANSRGTPDMLGGLLERMIYEPYPLLNMNPIGDLIDPGHYAKKHQYLYPTPQTGSRFEEVPLFGPLLSLLDFKGNENIREKEWKDFLMESGIPTYGNIGGNASPYERGGQLEGGARIKPKASFTQTIDESMYRVQELAGLWGFQANALFEGHYGRKPFENEMALETGRSIASRSRQYWDAEVGDPILLCLIGSTQILTPFGNKNISDIKKGDMVMSDGIFRKVVNTLKKEAYALRKLKISGIDVELIGTPNHHIPIFKRNPCKDNNKRPCLPNMKKRCLKNCKNEKNIIIEDKQLKNICVGDYVLYPINQNKKRIEYIDISQNDSIKTENYIYFGGTSQERADAFEIKEKNPNIKRKDLVEKGFSDSISKDTIRYSKINKYPKRVKKNIKLTDKFLYFLGWYIAEGHSDKRGCITLTIHKKEKDIVKNFNIELSNLLQYKVNGNFYDDVNSLGTVYKFSSKPLSEWLLKEFGKKATEKHIPQWIIDLPTDQLVHILKGLIEGDGWLNKNGGGFTSVSPELCKNVFDILLKLNIRSTCKYNYLEIPKENSFYPQGTKRHNSVRSYINFNKVDIPKLFKLFYNENIDPYKETHRSFIYDNFLFCPVVSNEELDYVESVYDLSIEGLHYYTANGILVHNTEMWRRFTPRPRDNRNVETFNPLVNALPEWLPASLQVGNVLTKVQSAEDRTPGRGYETLNSVEKTFPISAEYLGLTVEDTTRVMLGLYKKDRMKILSEAGIITKNEKLKENILYDKALDIDGSVSRNIKTNVGGIVEKTINISDDQLASFSGIRDRDISYVNWIMKQQGADHGVLTYMNNGQVIQTQALQYNDILYKKDITTVIEARNKAQNLLSNGIGFTGQSYSHIDRLKILGDIAPQSKEYRREKFIVQKQIESGDYMLQKEVDKIERYRSILSFKRELYPRRFVGKMFRDDHTENIYNLNENIKSADQYSFTEKALGNIWERFASLNTPINNRFLSYRTPLEDYQRNYLYGRDLKLWEKPIEHWILPYTEGIISKTDPVSGAIATGTGGFIFSGGSPAFTLMGAGIGAVYGGLHGAYRYLTDTTYIPGRVKGERSANRLFDKIKYNRGRILYEETGDTKYFTESLLTMTNTLNHPVTDTNISAVVSSTYKQERPYMQYFLQERDSNERKSIEKFVPDEVKSVLNQYWRVNQDLSTQTEVPGRELRETQGPGFSNMVYDENVNLNDVKYVYVDSKGYDAHNFGLGYMKQVRKVERQPGIRDIASRIDEKYEGTSLSKDKLLLKQQIDDILKNYNLQGYVTILPSNVDSLIINNG